MLAAALCGPAALAQRGSPPPELHKPFRFDDKPIPRAIPVTPSTPAGPTPIPVAPAPAPSPAAATPKPMLAPEPDEPGTIRIAPSTAPRSQDQVQLEIADGFYTKKMFDQAAPEYERYLGLFPNGDDRPAALYRLGESYRHTGAANASRNAYETLLSQFANGDFIGPAAYRLADLYYRDKQYRDALPLYRKSSVRLKEPVVANAAKFYTGRCLEALGQKLDARLTYEELAGVADKNPFQDASRLSLALLYKESGRTADALKQVQALAKQTENADLKIEAMVRTGLWMIDLDQGVKAEKQLREAIDVAGNSKWREVARLGLLRLQFDGGKYEEVYSTYTKSEKEFSAESKPDLLLLAANAARQLGKVSEARALYEQILKDYPATPVAKEAEFARLKLLYYNDDPELVVEIDKFLEGNPGAAARDQVTLMKAESFYKKQDYQNALPLYSALELSRTLSGSYKAEAVFKLGFCYVQLHDLEHGIKAFTNFIDMYPTNKSIPYALIQRALAYQQMKNLTAALKDYEQIISRFPKAKEREMALEQRGLLLGQQGDNAGMVEAFKTLLKDFPATAAKAQASYWIGWAAFESKNYKDCIAPLRAARELDKEHYFEKASFRVLLAAFNLEDKAETAKEIEIYTKDGKEKVPAQILRWLGTELFKDGSLEQAVKYFGMLTIREEAVPDDFLFLGRSRFNLKQNEESVEAFQAYLKLVKEPVPRATGLLDLAQACIGTGDFDAAQKAADEALTLQPEGTLNGEGRIVEGDILSARGKFEDAAKTYRAVSAVIDDETVTPRALEKAVAAYKKAGNEAEARKTLNLLQSRYPEYFQRNARAP
ncbi:MAG TPA: tetratricopeptide repeat protein [Chthoniobacteraceae bacterium]|nr:tetratricopeptide repeat protein [Chthoniobacteraceae bacterium]